MKPRGGERAKLLEVGAGSAGGPRGGGRPVLQAAMGWEVWEGP